MSALLSRFGLRMQIAWIGIIAVASLLFVGGIYALGQASIGRYQAEADVAQELLQANGRLNEQLLEARRAEKDFLLRREERYADRHAKFVEEARRELGRLSPLLVRLPELAALQGKVAAIGDGFGAYVGHFAKTVELERKLGLTENNGLQGTLRGSVHAIETKLKEADELRLTALMLTMRRHEKDFILRGTPRYVAELDKSAKELLKALDTSSLTGSAFEEIKRLLAAYQRDFATFAAVKVELAATAKALSEAYAAIDPIVGEVAKAVEARSRAAEVAIKGERAATARMMWGAIGASIGLLAILAFLIGRALAAPILRLNGIMGRLAAEDLAVTVPDQVRRDEVGAMARSVQVFKDGLIAKREADAAMAQENAAKMRRAQAVDALTRRFEASVSSLTQSLSSAATEMEATAQSMSRIAQDTSGQTVNVAGAAEQTSANVQTVAAATEELSISVREIAGQMGQTSATAARAVAKAQSTDATMQELSVGAQKIGDVVALINSIAAQTNLLALNATIEAARAGEAGKGFAVVASEVKALAGQTTKATEEISGQIVAIQQTTLGAVEAVREIGAIIAEMSSTAASVAAAVEEQGAATGEIARNVQEAARGTEAVTGAIREVRQGAGETGAAAAQVLGAAKELAGHSVNLNQEVVSFLAEVKAA
ncbi:MAG TPA: methyl-accepting chemotaxis protein [Beijerinckiaceae bacterium]|jgi:methyl-accepting chemotaxis protein